MIRFPKSRWFSAFLFLTLAVILLYYAFGNVDIKHLSEGFKNVNYFWIAVSLAIALLAHALRALRWGYLIESLGSKPKFTNLFSAVMFGYLANLALPRFGEIAKCGSIRKVDNVRFDQLVGTVVVERAADLLMLLLFTIAIVLINLDKFGSYIYNRIVLPLHQKALHMEGYKLVITVTIALVFIFGMWLLLRTNFFGERLNGKIRNGVKGVLEGLKAIYHTPHMFGFILTSILIWLCYWLMTWTLFYSTPITADLHIWDALFIMVIGSYGMTVPVQGGFGAYHIIAASALGIYGITYEDGLIFAVISHESQTLLLIVIGLISMLYLFIKRK